MGKLTNRGNVVAAGGNALAAGDDDTLTSDQNNDDTEPAGATGASDTGDQVETVPAAEDDDPSAPAPAVKETAVDVVAGDRETRES